MPAPKRLNPITKAQINNPAGGSTQNIEVGDRVRHDRFGIGEVLLLDGTDLQNIKAKILFEGNDEKNLLLKFAKLIKIS